MGPKWARSAGGVLVFFLGAVWVHFGPNEPCFGLCGGFGWFPLVFLCILVELMAFGGPPGQGFEAKQFDQIRKVFDQNEPKSANFNQNHVLVDVGAFWLVWVVIFRRGFVLSGSPADWAYLRLDECDFL